MIKGTTSDCIIKDIKISKSKAYITLIITSTKLNEPAHPLQIYIKDYDLDIFKSTIELKLVNDLLDVSGAYYKMNSDAQTLETTEPVSNTVYWLDKLNSYSDNSYNVNINMYKEIVIEVDISNKNTASIINNRFVRQIRLQLYNINTKKFVWTSYSILLISKQLSLPEIKHISLFTDKDYTVSGQFVYVYTDDEDFSYNNQHLFTTIVVKSPQTLKTLEVLTIEDEDYFDSAVRFTLNNKYTEPIIISIILKSYYGSEMILDEWINNDEYTEKLVGGIAMKTISYTYTPKVKYSTMFTKQNGDIKRIVDVYATGYNITNVTVKGE